MLVIRRVKAFLKERGIRISDEAIKALDEEIQKICLKTRDNVLADQVKTAKRKHIPKLDGILELSSKF